MDITARTVDPAISLRHMGVSSPAQVTVIGFVLVLALAFATRSMALTAIALLGALLLIAIHLPLFSRSSRTERQVLLLTVLVLTLSLPIAAWRNEAAVFHYLVALLMLGAAFVLTRDPHVYLRASRWLLLVVQGSVSVYLSQSGLANFPLERMLPESSSNGITSYLIILQANYCITRYALLRQPAFITPLLTLLICIVGYGRGSLLAAVLILYVNGMTLISSKHRVKMWLLGLSFLLILAVVWTRYDAEIILFLEANTKISGGFYDAHRELIIRDYLERMDGPGLLIGADYRGLSIEEFYNNNPHNSYIRGHHIFGLPYVLLMLVYPLLLMSSRLARGQQIYVLAIIFIALFRAFTEPVLFPTMLDLFFFGACFCIGRPDAAGGAQKVSI